MSTIFTCGLLGIGACTDPPATATLSTSSSQTYLRTQTSIAFHSTESDIWWPTSTFDTSATTSSSTPSSLPLAIDLRSGSSASASTSILTPTPSSTATSSTILSPSSSPTSSSSQTSSMPSSATFSTATSSAPVANTTGPPSNADSQPQGWIIALIVLSAAALLASIGACTYVYFSRWRQLRRGSIPQDVIESHRARDGTISSLAMLPGTPRSSPSSTLDTPSVYTTSFALGSWTNLPLLTPTLTPGFDAQSQQASVHDAAYFQSSVHIVPPSDDQSLRGSRSVSPGTIVSSGSHTASTSASKAATAKTFVTGATAGSRPPPVPPLSEIPLPPPPVPHDMTRAQSAPGHARANTQTSSKTFDTAATAGSVGVTPTPSVPVSPVSRPQPVPRPLPTPAVQGHARADTQTSSQTFATEATQGSHPSIPWRRQSMPSSLVPHDPFASTGLMPLAVAEFPHWPPTPSDHHWPPQSPPPPPPPPVPPIPQHHREAARVSGKSTASTARSPPSYRTVAGP